MAKTIQGKKKPTKIHRVERFGLKRARATQNARAEEIGRSVVKRMKPGDKVAVIKVKQGPKNRVAERLITTRAGKKKTGRLTLARKPARTFNSQYRTTWAGMDEAFSTAFTRELVNGIIKQAGPNGLAKMEWEQLVKLIDQASAARMSTEFSGYATKDGAMQHPTGKGKGLFAKSTANHGTMDTARRTYVDEAMTAEMKAGKSAAEIVASGVRASIEFTLNHFTAPITAKNVFSYSARYQKGNTFTQTDNRQVAERERLKDLYERLGGKLRPLKVKETSAQSLTREWTHDLDPFTKSGAVQREPPSPRRKPNLPKSVLETYRL